MNSFLTMSTLIMINTLKLPSFLKSVETGIENTLKTIVLFFQKCIVFVITHTHTYILYIYAILRRIKYIYDTRIFVSRNRWFFKKLSIYIIRWFLSLPFRWFYLKCKIFIFPFVKRKAINITTERAMSPMLVWIMDVLCNARNNRTSSRLRYTADKSAGLTRWDLNNRSFVINELHCCIFRQAWRVAFCFPSSYYLKGGWAHVAPSIIQKFILHCEMYCHVLLHHVYELQVGKETIIPLDEIKI